MNKKVKIFMHDIELNDSDNYFLLLRFYNNPEDVLGGSTEETIKDYQNYGEIKKLVFNKSFFELLDILFKFGDQDEEFFKKLKFNLLRKIKFIIYDTLNFNTFGQIGYIKDLEDEYLKQFCRGEVPVGKYANKYNTADLYAIIMHYKEYGWLYDLGIKNLELENRYISKNLLVKLLNTLNIEIDLAYSTQIEPLSEQHIILQRIINDDYENNDNLFLDNRSGNDKKSINALVCSNEFLDIIEHDLLNKKLSDKIINNIMEILNISISLKKHTFEILYNPENTYNYISILGEDRINNYNYKKAEKLCAELQKKLIGKNKVRFRVITS